MFKDKRIGLDKCHKYTHTATKIPINKYQSFTNRQSDFLWELISEHTVTGINDGDYVYVYADSYRKSVYSKILSWDISNYMEHINSDFVDGNLIPRRGSTLTVLDLHEITQ